MPQLLFDLDDVEQRKPKDQEEPSKQKDKTENTEHGDGKHYGEERKDLETYKLEKEEHSIEHTSPTAVAKFPHGDSIITCCEAESNDSGRTKKRPQGHKQQNRKRRRHKVTVEQVSEGDDNDRLSEQQNVLTHSQLRNSTLLPELPVKLDDVDQRNEKGKEEPSKQADETEDTAQRDWKNYDEESKDLEIRELDKEEHDTEHSFPTSVAKIPHASFCHKIAVEQVSEGDDNGRLSDHQNVITYSQLGNSTLLPELLVELDDVEQRKENEKEDPSKQGGETEDTEHKDWKNYGEK